MHVLDAAHLFRLAVESAPAGSVLHGVVEEGAKIRAVALVIGRHLNVPVVSVPQGQAGQHFSWLGALSAWTVRPPAQSPASCWTGSRRIRG